MIQCNAIGNENNALIAGGMESMSNIPHYLPSSRSGSNLGHAQLLDGVIYDGLWDVYNNQHMGLCAEKCASDYNISREEQDAYALESYSRAQKSISDGDFNDEIEPVEVRQKRERTIIKTDEEPLSVDFDRIPTLRPAFTSHDGTVTAANASSLNDGAAAMVIMSEEAALRLGLRPLARILGYGDAAQDPVDFTTTPSLAVPVALKNAGLAMEDIEYHEINEAFSVVVSYNRLFSIYSMITILIIVFFALGNRKYEITQFRSLQSQCFWWSCVTRTPHRHVWSQDSGYFIQCFKEKR